MTKDPKIYCSYDKLIPVSELKPHPRNPATHPAAQIKLLAQIISKAGWRSAITVSARSGYVIAGHGRLQAAIAGGFTVAPVDCQEFPDDAAEVAHLVADNRIASLAEINSDALGKLLRDYQGIDPAMIAYDPKALDALLKANPAADLAGVIKAETEHRTEDTLDPEAVIASLTGHVQRLAQQHPERLRDAMAVILPAGRGHTRDILILADPACADAAAELRRLAEAGTRSPVTALLSVLLPLGGK